MFAMPTRVHGGPDFGRIELTLPPVLLVHQWANNRMRRPGASSDGFYFTVNPNDQDVEEGQPLRLRCAVTPSKDIYYSWLHNGERVDTEQGNGRRYLEADSNLQIVHADRDLDHGTYQCQALNRSSTFTTASQEAKVNIYYTLPPLPITVLPNENFTKYVVPGQSVELSCPQLGPQRKFLMPHSLNMWIYVSRLGEHHLAMEMLPDIKFRDQDTTLIIKRFAPQHVNYYICESSWDEASEKHMFIFQLEMATLYAPKRSDFSPRLKKSQPYVVRIGEDAELRYYSDLSPSNSYTIDQVSNPPPKIEWRKKGEPHPITIWSPTISYAHSDASTTRSEQPPRRYALRARHLIIQKVTEADAGTYEMYLTNVAGSESIAFDLLVTFPPEFIQPQSHVEHSFDEDDATTLHCGIKRRAFPGSIVYWEKDQRVLKKYTTNSLVLEDNGETLRFPKLRPEDQGQYQCFVQTDGYTKRAAGQEQTLVVKAKLQFLRESRDQFLEVNSVGRIPCKVRGYGALKVDWFRKTGPRASNLQPIRPPNQVEAGGTLVIQYVQKADAGDYVCIAQSNYKNARINTTVNIVVGEKPQISQISPNQTVSIGSQLILNCHATGDPVPQISWIAKRAGFMVYTPKAEEEMHGNEKSISDIPSPGTSLQSLGSLQPSNPEVDSDPMMAAIMTRNWQSGTGRVRAFQNGSLVVNQASLADQAEYICVANNRHAVETRQGLFVRVLLLKMHENGQLLTPMGEPNGPSGMIGISQSTGVGRVVGSGHGVGHDLDSGFPNTATVGSVTSATGSAPYSLTHNMHVPPFSSTMVGAPRNGFGYPELDSHRTTMHTHSSVAANGLGSACSHLPSINPQDTQEWWPWKTNGYFNPAEMQLKVPHGTPATPVDIASEATVDISRSKPTTHTNVHPLASTPCGYFFNGDTHGAENSTTATTASEPQLVSAPPPTPLDSRSHFSGVSSGNSTSLYSRSLFSGASNLGLSSGAQNVGEASPIYRPLDGASSISQTDRMHYPRCELKVEGILGKGLFGDVFLARARRIQEEEAQSLVLVKSLTSHESAHINEFHRQLELFGKLNHERVTRLLGICMEQEPFYMILEYCEWGDLKMFLRRIRDEDHHSAKTLSLTCDQKLNMCHQLSMAMEYLSQMRCVHRDLAARNVFLTQDMELKISSPALCRDVYASEYYRLPNTDQFIPLRWFAPELIAEALPISLFSANATQLDYGHSFSGPSLPYTIQTDIWAFAIVVCEIFSLATLPLSRLTDQEIIVAGRQTAIQSNLMLNDVNALDFTTHNQVVLRPDIPAEIPPELSSLVARCFAPAARHRPDSTEISSTLRDLMS
ncbi:PTK7 protein tyrosine kinase 7 [Paragonimus westermani]|uniref:Tyrosine-protein kinase-like otk n=1 Tax=Paragonimus westermani TaxID=34504 RepID=A0A5J4NYE6_9TREM|nr:PTK7 protein tyrosine kinase 7 [Paragonimus westermani]